jgi:hypothetical protein
VAKAAAVGLAELQRTIRTVLATDPITTTLGAAVYDDIPQSAGLPVIRVDIVPGEPWDTFGRAGDAHLVDCHVFAAYQGTLLLAALIDAIVGKLDGAALTVPGYRVWDVMRQAQREGEDELVGGVKTKHRVVPFRVLMTAGEQP